MNEQITIRSIQHYLYCPRRFGLIKINRSWNENASVIIGNIMHEKVHSGEHSFSDSKGFCRSDIELYDDELNIVGKVDCIEFEKSRKAGYSEKLKGNYTIRIVEYKPTKPKNDIQKSADEIQVFAQKVCADKIFGVDSESYMYYGDIRRRVKLPFDTEYDKYYSMLIRLLSEMREILDSKIIPEKPKGQKCSGCSLADECMSKKVSYSVKNEIRKMTEEEI